MKGNAGMVIASAVLSIMCSISAVLVYHQWFAVKIVSAETSSFLDQAREDYINHNISKEELTKRLEQVIALVRNQPENRIVLTSDVVLSKNVETIYP